MAAGDGSVEMLANLQYSIVNIIDSMLQRQYQFILLMKIKDQSQIWLLSLTYTVFFPAEAALICSASGSFICYLEYEIIKP